MVTAVADNRIYKAYWQDGSIDLFAGLGLAVLGIGWLAGVLAIASVFPATLVLVYANFRTKFIEPRIGYVRFNEERRSKDRRGYVTLIALGFLALLLGVSVFVAFRRVSSGEQWMRIVIPALPAVLVGIGGAIAALMFGIHRLALYSVVCVAGGAAVALLRMDPGWSLLAGGSVAVASGGVILMRFFRKFPVLPTEIE